MYYCPKCEEEFEEDENLSFCPECGTLLKKKPDLIDEGEYERL